MLSLQVCPLWEHWVTREDSQAKSVLPTSSQPAPDLCLGWGRSAQQKHVLKEASDVNVSNNRAKEEVPKQAGWNGCEGGGREENSGQAALACWVPRLQYLTQRLMSLLLQVPDVEGGVEAWHVRVEEDGPFQVGIFLGAQLQAPEGLQAALKPLHSSQRGLGPIWQLISACTARLLQQDLLEYAGSWGLSHLKGHSVLGQPKQEEGAPAAPQQQPLILGEQLAEGWQVPEKDHRLGQNVQSLLAGAMRGTQLNRSVLPAQAAATGWRHRGPGPEAGAQKCIQNSWAACSTPAWAGPWLAGAHG